MTQLTAYSICWGSWTVHANGQPIGIVERDIRERRFIAATKLGVFLEPSYRTRAEASMALAAARGIDNPIPPERWP